MALNLYNVTGRYMNGKECTGYHLVDANGTSYIVNRDKAILLISRGQIENMRVQYSGDDVIIRGKGINLNTLPVFDANKDKFRANAPQQGTTPKTTQHNPMSQFKIVKRLMYKNSVFGYIIQDATGREARISKAKANELASIGKILNAEATKYTPKGSTESVVVLRGVGCELNKLPVVVVDQSGNAVDTTNKNQTINSRASLLRRAGVLYNDEKRTRKTFSVGDYIIITPTGELGLLSAEEAKKALHPSDNTEAICDSYLDNVSKYSVEFFGSSRQPMSAKVVKNWRIVKISR